MKLIIDTNILLSALIKDSITRAILMTSGEIFYYPETALGELEKYKGLARLKSGLSESEFNIIFNAIKNKIIVLPEDIFTSKLIEANKEIGRIDIKDVMFLALALAIPNDGIWSEDMHFEHQSKIKIWKTSELIGFLNKEE